MSLDDTIKSPQEGAPAAVDRKLGLALLVIATAQLMLVLDDTIVNVALPSMQRSLHIPASHLNWVASFYALTFGGLLIAGGRAGDLFGRLRMFRIGVVVFAVASMAGGLAPNGTVLLIARLVQGCGAAIAAPGALSLLATTFPAGPARTKALGVYGSMAGVGSVLGLLLGGALTEYASWRWVFFINVPIAVAVLIGSRTLVTGERERGSLDIVGAVIATLAIGAVVYGLTSGNTNGWGDPVTLGCFAGGALLLVLFVLREVPVPHAAGANPDCGQPQQGGRVQRHAAARRRHARHVLSADPLHAVRAGILGAAHGPGLPPVRDRARCRRRRARASALRQAPRSSGDRRRHVHLRRRAGLVRGDALAHVGLLRGHAPGARRRRIRRRARPSWAPRRSACTASPITESGAAAGVFNASIQVGAAIGLSALASIAAIVTRAQLQGHTMATALTNGYVAGLTAGAAIFALGAVVALVFINVSIGADEIAGH